MTIDLDRFVKFLRDAKITPSQYTFLATMYEKKYNLIYMLKEISRNIVTKEELERLNKEKKAIMDIDPSKTTIEEMMEIYEPNRFKLLNP